MSALVGTGTAVIRLLDPASPGRPRCTGMNRVDISGAGISGGSIILYLTGSLATSSVLQSQHVVENEISKGNGTFQQKHLLNISYAI